MTANTRFTDPYAATRDWGLIRKNYDTLLTTPEGPFVKLNGRLRPRVVLTKAGATTVWQAHTPYLVMNFPEYQNRVCILLDSKGDIDNDARMWYHDNGLTSYDYVRVTSTAPGDRYIPLVWPKPKPTVLTARRSLYL